MGHDQEMPCCSHALALPFPYKFLSYFIIIGDGEWHALRVREQPAGAISFSDIKDAATHKD